MIDSHTTAATMVSLHSTVATVDRTSSKASSDLLHQTPHVVTLGNYIGQMQNQGKDWGRVVPAVQKDGSAAQLAMTDTARKTTTTAFASASQAPLGVLFRLPDGPDIHAADRSST